jgi:hypothetical protein
MILQDNASRFCAQTLRSNEESLSPFWLLGGEDDPILDWFMDYPPVSDEELAEYGVNPDILRMVPIHKARVRVDIVRLTVIEARGAGPVYPVWLLPSLSQGEFAGVVAFDPRHPDKLLHSESPARGWYLAGTNSECPDTPAFLPGIAPLDLHPTPLAWLQAGARGAVITSLTTLRYHASRMSPRPLRPLGGEDHRRAIAQAVVPPRITLPRVVS